MNKINVANNRVAWTLVCDLAINIALSFTGPELLNQLTNFQLRSQHSY